MLILTLYARDAHDTKYGQLLRETDKAIDWLIKNRRPGHPRVGTLGALKLACARLGYRYMRGSFDGVHHKATVIAD